jgi:hypothetical protein
MNLASAQGAFRLKINGTAVTFPTPAWDATETVMTVTPAAAFAYGDAVTWDVTTAAQDKGGLTLTPALSGGFHVVKLGSTSLSPVANQSGFIFNAGASVGVNQAMVMGDIGTNVAYRGFASFALAASIPATTTAITSAQVTTTAGISQGSPFSGGLGTLVLQSVFYDTLDASDWDVATDLQRCLITLGGPGDSQALAPHASLIIPPIRLYCNIEWAETASAFTQDVTGKVQRDFADTARKGLTQFRVRFTTDTDANGLPDYITSSPKLAVSYEFGW